MAPTEHTMVDLSEVVRNGDLVRDVIRDITDVAYAR